MIIKKNRKVIGQMKENIVKLQIELKTLSEVKKYVNSNEQMASNHAPILSNQNTPSFRQQVEEGQTAQQQKRPLPQQLEQQPVTQQRRPSPQYGPVSHS